MEFQSLFVNLEVNIFEITFTFWCVDDVITCVPRNYIVEIINVFNSYQERLVYMS